MKSDEWLAVVNCVVRGIIALALVGTACAVWYVRGEAPAWAGDVVMAIAGVYLGGETMIKVATLVRRVRVRRS